MIRFRTYWLGTCVLSAVAFSSTVAWADTEVAIVNTVQASAKLIQDVQQTATNTMYGLAVGVVPPEKLTPEGAACAKPDCFAALAKRVGATHVLVVQGSADPSGYRLSLNVRDGATGRSLGTDGKDCELCEEDQFTPAVEERIGALWNRVMQEQEAANAAPAVVVPPVEQRPGVETTVVTPWWKQRTPVMGLGFMAAGLVAAGFGAYYVAVDGDTVTSNRINANPIILRDTGKWGWTLVGVGVASLAVGTAMVIWGTDDGTHVSVAVGPGSLGLQGRF